MISVVAARRIIYCSSQRISIANNFYRTIIRFDRALPRAVVSGVHASSRYKILTAAIGLVKVPEPPATALSCPPLEPAGLVVPVLMLFYPLHGLDWRAYYSLNS